MRAEPRSGASRRCASRSQRRRISAENGPTTRQYRRNARRAGSSTAAILVSVESTLRPSPAGTARTSTRDAHLPCPRGGEGPMPPRGRPRPARGAEHDVRGPVVEHLEAVARRAARRRWPAPGRRAGGGGAAAPLPARPRREERRHGRGGLRPRPRWRAPRWRRTPARRRRARPPHASSRPVRSQHAPGRHHGPPGSRPADLGHRPLQLPLLVLHAEVGVRPGLPLHGPQGAPLLRGDRARRARLRPPGRREDPPHGRRAAPPQGGRGARRPARRDRRPRPDADDERVAPRAEGARAQGRRA